MADLVFSPEAQRARRVTLLSKLTPEDMLEELLAVIHGDGGHYSDEHGLAKAVADAEVKWYDTIAAAERNAGVASDAPDHIGDATEMVSDGVKAVEPKRDYCTDPNNCQRCKADSWDQPKYHHAGIPLGLR